MKKIMLLSKWVIVVVTLLHQVSNMSQERISLSIYQDAKLLLLGDTHNNKAGTIDLLIKINMHGKQSNIGYPVYYIAYEQANLRILFKRYSINAGYTFNDIFFSRNRYHFLNRLEITPSIGYGIIKRYRPKRVITHKNWSFSTGISYQINPSFKVSIINQLIHRNDIKRKKNEPKIIRYSAFFGVEYSLFKTYKNRINSCLY
jgi:hypothetical protein